MMPEVMVPDLSIIIVSWNVREYVLACLESIHADATRPATEVILVDNASSDATVAAVHSIFPDVRVIENRENVGFPRANNQALAVARGRNVLFLNPDTEVIPGALAACVRELASDAETGAVGCRVESADGGIQYECARTRYRFRHLVYEVLYLHMLFPRSRIFGEHLMGYWDHRDSRDVEGLSGAFMMVPRDVAARVGGLPEDVFMYHEDLAFCMRIARTGKRIRYCADVSIIHHSGQSSRRSAARLGLLTAQVKHRFIREGDGAFWAALSRPVFAARSIIRLVICAGGVVLTPSFRRRYPRLFDWRTHVLQLVWAVAPGSVKQFDPSHSAGRSVTARLGEAA